MKISVVVPVYNPGEHIASLLSSIRRQSMPVTDFEVVLVDDGSTDGTGELLDGLAAQGAPWRVIHIPNSGWPGKPRNVGLDAARGEYVFFVDNDDALGDEALERMHRFATENATDVLIAKEVRRNVRKPAVQLWTENRPRAELSRALLTYLTPHKMFRRAFLLEHGLRFPEGPRRLEDHPFVMKTYFAAEVISVLADYPCYYWISRPDRTNAGLRPRVWAEWYGHLRDALDVVEVNTEPGEFRDSLLSHWYRSKGLRQLSATNLQADDGDALLAALHDLTEERFPPAVDHHLHGIYRVTSQLLRAGQFDRLRQLAEALTGIRVESRLESWGWEGTDLVLRVWARLVYADGTPVLLDGPDDQLSWCPPIPLDDVVDADRLRFGALPAHPLHVAVRHRQSYDTYALPGTTEPLPRDPSGRALVGAVRTARLAAGSLAAGTPLPEGVWEVDVQLAVFAWSARGLLRHPSGHKGATLPVASSPAGLVSPYAAAKGRLAVAVGGGRAVLRRGTPDVGASRLLMTDYGPGIEVPLDGLEVHGDPIAVELVLAGPRGTGARRAVPGALSARAPGGTLLRARLPERRQLVAALPRNGAVRLLAQLGDEQLALGLELARRRGRPVLQPRGTQRRTSSALPRLAQRITRRSLRRISRLANRR
jgi:glycosyltransferase involved in cell wall biosynthesis